MTEIRTIAVLRLGAMGDILFITPALRGLRLRYPRAKITGLCLDKWRFLLERNPNLDRVIGLKSMGPETLGSLMRESFDLVINLQEIESGAQICEALQAAQRRGNRWIDNTLVAGEPRQWPYLMDETSLQIRMDAGISRPELFCKIADVEIENLFYDFTPSGTDKWRASRFLKKHRLLGEGQRALIAMHLHSRGSAARCWNPEDARQVIRAMSDEVMFLILGYKPDRAVTASLETEPNAIVNLQPIGVQAAMLSFCQGFVGIDSGPRNLASAARLPLVGLFGPVPKEFLPVFDFEIALESPRSREPWNDAKAVESGSYLHEIPIEKITDALRQILK